METVGSKRQRRISPAQQARNEKTRRAIIQSAGHVVGQHGYAGCSISRVTERAGIAQGAFYLHFPKRQALFDVLLPEIGTEMVAEIAKAVRGATTLAEVERKGIAANIAYLVDNPHVYRVMFEASQYAPVAFKRHHDLLVAGYVRSFRRILGGDALDEKKMEMVASMLMGARSFLFMRYADAGTLIKPLDPEIIEIYVDFVESGMKRILQV
ncbi:TetR/AcrR family transcriptional regulator [Pseudooceanicola batsensis]|uniref:TetR/AcrR family transcriptional regulator n=1 Tax=Pseudooceanicola batsensis TaxID=314255 RepID=UPI00032096AB|nr:TetR/AcrR family transcriptional regulator [Pseudooceanicola batsensis]